MVSAREKLLVAIRDLLLERGFGGTSLDAICERAELSKGSFFHYFKSKEEAALETLDWFFESMKGAARQCGFEQLSDPRQRLVAYLDGMIKLLGSPQTPAGCLVGALAGELADSHPQIRRKTRACFQEWSGMAAGLIAEAIGPERAEQANGLADHFLAVVEGSLLLSKAHHDPAFAESSIRHFKRYVLSLIDEA